MSLLPEQKNGLQMKVSLVIQNVAHETSYNFIIIFQRGLVNGTIRDPRYILFDLKIFIIIPNEKYIPFLYKHFCATRLFIDE